MKDAGQQTKRSKIDLPDIGLALMIGGFVAYVIFRWSQELGASLVFGVIGSILTLVLKVMIYISRIRSIADQLEKRQAKDPVQREIEKLKRRRY